MSKPSLNIPIRGTAEVLKMAPLNPQKIQTEVVKPINLENQQIQNKIRNAGISNIQVKTNLKTKKSSNTKYFFNKLKGN